jgi:4-hydroxy-2-oxoheptanedioate aldolase
MTFRPKENRILSCLQRNEVPLGTQIYMAHPAIIEIIAYAGFDYYMLDMEHCRVNPETMEHCIRAADAAGITTVVRVPENNHTLIRGAMEAGAQGVIVPHINTKEDARKAVNALRYPPEGTAGMCPAIRSANYSVPSWDDYLEYHSNNTSLIALIESPQAVDNAEEIFAELKSGVDAVWFGRGDLAQAVAKPGEKVDWDPPYINEAFEKVLAVSKKTGIPVMAIPFPVLSPESAKEALAKGARIMLYSIDQLLFYNLCVDIVKAMKG